MKKSLTALLVLLLMAVLCACAGAEEAGKTDLFDLWDYGGESMTWVRASGKYGASGGFGREELLGSAGRSAG